MTHNRKKIAKIVEELTMFFFSVGADKIESCLEKEKFQYIIRFKANYDPEYRNNLESLDKYLNKPKNEAMEDIYWELEGSGDPGESSQLLLIGMMIDRAEIVINEDEKRVEVVLYRKRDRGLIDNAPLY